MAKILLIDDSRVQRFFNEQVLRNGGHEVITAADGEEALLSVWRQHPDLILLDILLPKMGGIEILEFLKKDKTTARIPILVLSCLSAKNADKLLTAGAAGFLEKGNVMDSPELLVKKVAEVLAMQKVQDGEICHRGDLSIVWQNRSARGRDPVYHLEFVSDDDPSKGPRSIEIQGVKDLEKHLYYFAIEPAYLVRWLDQLGHEDVLIPYIGMTRRIATLYGL